MRGGRRDSGLLGDCQRPRGKANEQPLGLRLGRENGENLDPRAALAEDDAVRKAQRRGAANAAACLHAGFGSTGDVPGDRPDLVDEGATKPWPRALVSDRRIGDLNLCRRCKDDELHAARPSLSITSSADVQLASPMSIAVARNRTSSIWTSDSGIVSTSTLSISFCASRSRSDAVSGGRLKRLAVADIRDS